MSKIRLTQVVVLTCITALAACTSSEEGGPAGNTQLNVVVPNNGNQSPSPDGDPQPPFIDIQTVEYTINCVVPPETFLDNNAPIDRDVQINGNLEVVDPPSDDAYVFQGWMDLPAPAACTLQMRAVDGDDEVICTAQDSFNTVPNQINHLNQVLMCDISFQAPVAMMDALATFSFNVGNFCPDLFNLNCLNTTPQVPSYGVPLAATECQVRYRDGDDTCGQNCDPQDCNVTPEGLSCSPAPEPIGGVSTTITCGVNALLDCTGDLTPDASCTFSGDRLGVVGQNPGVPVAVGGAGPGAPGGFFVACSPSGPPGATIQCTAVTTDGDTDCNKTKIVSINCPGLNFCDQVTAGDNLTDCNDNNSCTIDSCDRIAQACDYDFVPAGGGNNCPGESPSGGPGQCNGAGVCNDFGCQSQQDCENASTQCLVAPPNACTPPTCAAEVPGNFGLDCTTGTGSGDGSCGASGSPQAGQCVSNDECTSNAGCADEDGNVCTAPQCDQSSAPWVCGAESASAANGTPCTTTGGDPGLCSNGACQFNPPEQTVEVPMVCKNSFTNQLSDIPIGLVVDPTAINASQGFSASITPTLSFTVDFLNAALVQLPTLTDVLVADAKATIQAFGTTAGSNVVTNYAGTPCVVTPGNPNGCPQIFLDLCDGSDCPVTSPPTVATPLFVELQPVSGNWTAAASGQVCFDSFGTIPTGNITGTTPPTDTYLRVFALQAIAVVLACTPGTEDPANPDVQTAIIPNTDADRNCFDIQ